CCNDVVQERYAPELKYDIALRLAALHIHQHAISNNMAGKVTVKAIEREFGLERFVPVSLMTSMKRKELRKLIGHFLKLNHNLSPTGQKSLTSLQAKLYYLNIISELPSYGAKCFSTNIRDSNIERVVLVSPKFGISQIAGLRNSVPVPLADIEQMSVVSVVREDELSRCVRIHVPCSDEKELVLSMEDRDAEELVLVLQGYFRLLTGRHLPVEQDQDLSWTDDSAPPYHSQHEVLPAKWSYPSKESGKHYAAFSVPPPYQPIHGGRGDSQTKSNGHVPVSHSKSAPVDDESRSPYGVDNNMNSMSVLLGVNGSAGARDCNGYSSLEDNRRAVTQKLLDLSATTFDLQSVVSMEILESDLAFVEARNEEVLRRVAEMQELVQNSEQYLTQQQQQHHQNHHQQHQQQYPQPGKEESDSEGSHISSLDSDAPGQLKHSDSLLLLTQGQKLINDAVNDAVRGIDLGENEPSESDTDSMSTPTNSPSHRPTAGREQQNGTFHASSVKTNGSSFGLHSPDSLLPVGFRPSDSNIQDLLKRLQEDTSLPYNFAEGALYLDPDIIDLTMIPPPITPDEEGLYALPPQLSLPPTPFADQSPLEAELQVKTEKLINHKNSVSNNYTGTLSLDEQDSLIETKDWSRSVAWLICEFPKHAYYELLGLDLNLDFEAFLATVTVPPPTHQAAPSVELTPEEISSFIIPPPPTSSSTDTLNQLITLSMNPMRITLQNRKSCSLLPGEMSDLEDLIMFLTSSGFIAENFGQRLANSNFAHSHGKLSSPDTNHCLDTKRLYDKITVVKLGDVKTPVNEENGFAKKSANSTKVIEYPTVNRKGAFSCCGKYRESPEKSTAEAIQPPPRSGSESLKPPARPPKSSEHLLANSLHQRSNSLSNGNQDLNPPMLPPRSDSIHSQHPWLPPKKPPLPPIPSQTFLHTQKSVHAIIIVKIPKLPGEMSDLEDFDHVFEQENRRNITRCRRRRIQLKAYVAQLERAVVLQFQSLSPSSGASGRPLVTLSNSSSPRTSSVMSSSQSTLITQTHISQFKGNSCAPNQIATDGRTQRKPLTNEARQLVTASKLLVKSATDVTTRQELPGNLATCLQLLHRLAELSSDMTTHTTAPLQTRNLVLKVRDVASVFRELLSSALDLEVEEAVLLQRAEGLASVLATLLRSLRVFSP
ncbi:hypothetical protein L9F63_002771, partial [Diploptera punctata]